MILLHLAMQERDGFKSQVESLRDKISALSREIAACEAGAHASSERSAALEHDLAAARGELAAVEEARRSAQLAASAVRASRALM